MVCDAHNKWFVINFRAGTFGPTTLVCYGVYNTVVIPSQRVCYPTTTHWLPDYNTLVIRPDSSLPCSYYLPAAYLYLLVLTCTYLYLLVLTHYLPALTCLICYLYLPATCTYLPPFFRKNKKFLTDPFQNTPCPSSNSPDPPPDNHKKIFRGPPPLPVCPF